MLTSNGHHDSFCENAFLTCNHLDEFHAREKAASMNSDKQG